MAASNEFSSPQFLTIEYVENILKHYFKDSTLNVINCETFPASAKGESYCSVMTRMHIDYKLVGEEVTKQINCIVKSTFENESKLLETLKQYDVFNTEMEMYENVFPQLQRMLKEVGDSDQLCAKTIHVDNEHDVIILENLSQRNFVMANRLEGLSEIVMKTCLRKLAKMHAAAAVLNERQKGSLEKYTHGIFNRHVNCYGIFFENVIAVCAQYAGTCPDLGAYYKDKLLQLIPYVSEKATRCCDPKPEHFVTLNHGDLWTNNCMVQYSDGKVEDVLLIDFQYCNWASPAIDLHYLFNTSLQDDLLLNQQPKFIQYYHSVLSQTLEKLMYRQHIPTLHELNIQLLERGFYAVTSALVNLPLMINDKTEDAGFDCFISSNEKAIRFQNVLYTNERVHRIVKLLLPRFDQMGLLDAV